MKVDRQILPGSLVGMVQRLQKLHALRITAVRSRDLRRRRKLRVPPDKLAKIAPRAQRAEIVANTGQFPPDGLLHPEGTFAHRRRTLATRLDRSEEHTS